MCDRMQMYNITMYKLEVAKFICDFLQKIQILDRRIPETWRLVISRSVYEADRVVIRQGSHIV
jgi:hypothetical protein